MNIMRAASRGCVAGIVLLAAGCVLPEDFDARVQIHPDGSATFTYRGKLADVQVLADLQQSGADAATDRDEVQARRAELQQEPGFHAVEYLGKGRYAVQVERQLRPGEYYAFPPGDEGRILQIEPQTDGTLLVRTGQADTTTLRELEPLGVHMHGTFHVIVDPGVEVLQQNAQTSPSLAGLYGIYGWEIKGPQTEPVETVVKIGS